MKRYRQYRAYLKSENWKRKKRQATYWHGKRCVLCGRKSIEIHHKTYRRLFEENARRDLAPLCRVHHQQMHDEARRTGDHVWHVTERALKQAGYAQQTKRKKTWAQMTPHERDTYLGKAL